jgi:hypothetical protein
MLNERLIGKALKSWTLAVSALQVGSYEEAKAAAYRFGALAYSAGATTHQVYDEIWLHSDAETLWPTIVDGWYDTMESKTDNL